MKPKPSDSHQPLHFITENFTECSRKLTHFSNQPEKQICNLKSILSNAVPIFLCYRWKGGGDKGELKTLHDGARKGVWRARNSLQLHQDRNCQKWVRTDACENVQRSWVCVVMTDIVTCFLTHIQTVKNPAGVKRIRGLSASYAISCVLTEGETVTLFLYKWAHGTQR